MSPAREALVGLDTEVTDGPTAEAGVGGFVPVNKSTGVLLRSQAGTVPKSFAAGLYRGGGAG
jgi:hypothetical protein